MRILFVSHLHPPHDAPLESLGGMQRVSMQLMEALSAQNQVELHAETLHAPWNGIVAETILFMIRQLAGLPHLVREKQIDVVLFSSMVTGALAPVLRKKVDVPMVAICHGRDVTLPVAPYQMYLPLVFRSLDAIVSVSNATRNECLNRGLSAEKAKVLPNGFPLREVGVITGQGTARQQMPEHLRIKENERVLLSVGRMVRRKGHLWFLENVLPLVKQPVTWLVVGDGPDYAELSAAVSRGTGIHRVLLAGKVDDAVLDAAYRAADIFVMPNIPVAGDMEGFGIVMLEANARGIPVVAADLEGISDVVEPGLNGWLIPPLDAAAFAAKLEQLVKNEIPLAPASLQKYVEKRFGWDAIAMRYLQLFESIPRFNRKV